MSARQDLFYRGNVALLIRSVHRAKHVEAQSEKCLEPLRARGRQFYMVRHSVIDIVLDNGGAGG